MPKFSVSKWFIIEAESFKEAYDMADNIDTYFTENEGIIDVEACDEDYEELEDDE